jgi:hypothetical protein
MALAMSQKGSMSVNEYVNKLRALSNEMASVGKPLNEEEMASYILTDLDIEYNLIVLVVVARVEPIIVNEMYG